MAVNEVRVRRPAQHEALIQHLRDEGGFATMRDALLFAAGLGVLAGRRAEFDESNEPIRYDTLIGSPYAEAFLNMLAASARADDAEILDGSRLAERVQLFEESANGGLSYLQEQLNTRRQPLEVVLAALVTESLSAEGRSTAPDVEELLEGMY